MDYNHILYSNKITKAKSAFTIFLGLLKFVTILRTLHSTHENRLLYALYNTYILESNLDGKSIHNVKNLEGKLDSIKLFCIQDKLNCHF